MTFQIITTDQVRDMMVQDDVTIIDMRDTTTYSQGHINSAQAMGNLDIDKFAQEQSKESPLILYCYHGHSSQGAASWFAKKGSLMFTAWRAAMRHGPKADLLFWLSRHSLLI